MNLVLPEELLAEVCRLSGKTTRSAAVLVAMEHYVRRVKAGTILQLRGSGAWEGSLTEMRGGQQ